MAQFAAPFVVLPGYKRPPSRLRRGLIIGAQLAAAALYGFGAVALPAEMRFILIIPVVVCLLIALWIMPDRSTFPLTAIERGYRVLLVFLIAWPEYIAVVLPGLPWLTPTRMALFLVIFLLFYSLSTSALLRRHLIVVVTQSRWWWTAFLMWQVSMVVSLPFSQQIGTSIKSLVDRQLNYTMFVFIGCLVFLRRVTPPGRSAGSSRSLSSVRSTV